MGGGAAAFLGSSGFEQAKVVIDDWTQASHSGEINVPVSQKQMTKRDIHAQLGDVVAGKKKGRTSAKEITAWSRAAPPSSARKIVRHLPTSWTAF